MPWCAGSIDLPCSVKQGRREHVRGGASMGFVGAPNQVHGRVIEVFGDPIDELIGIGTLSRNTGQKCVSLFYVIDTIVEPGSLCLNPNRRRRRSIYSYSMIP